MTWTSSRRTRWLGAFGALLLASGAAAQTFPPPGTGTFTWERVGPDPTRGYPDRFKPEGFSFGPNAKLYIATTDTAYVFEPGPDGPPQGTWRSLGPPPTFVGNNTILPLDVRGDTVLLGQRGFIHRSADGGMTWRRVTQPPYDGGLGGPDHSGAFFELPPGHPHSGRILSGPRLYSDDRGVTWSRAVLDSPGSLPDAHTFELLPSGRVLSGGYWGVATSDDGGPSYTTSPLYGGYHYEVDGLAANATPGSRQAGDPACGLLDGTLCDGVVAVGIDAFGDGTYAWRSNDGGRSWSEAVHLAQPDDGIGYGIVAGVVDVGPGADGLGRAIAVLGRGMVYKTADGGQTWEAIGRLPMDRLYPDRPGGDYAEHVVLGPDGHLWVLVFQTGPSSNSIYRSAEPALVAFPVSSEASPVEVARLGVSVRPNPARGRVEIALSLAEASAARVVVVDVLGREVAVVLDGLALAGERSVGVDTSGWPVGIYVVRATTGSLSATARLVVAR